MLQAGQIGETGAIRGQEGYTLKEAERTDPDVSQTTLCRKPNNGLIDNNIVGANQLLLAGNPIHQH
jgi:hypothetical protein